MFILRKFWWLSVILFLSTGLEGRTTINQEVAPQFVGTAECEIRDISTDDIVDGWVGCSIDKIKFDKEKPTMRKKLEPIRVSLVYCAIFTAIGSIMIFLLT